ncbi:hypothetical protein CEXT_387341 [Caerostris extrusa]|uniref:Uncharacterized protein n=1 Tax=Caerostris extrusa TaxID=172846 RepID=A0AAV4RFC4_CAEEX|nr:hypothetical protein CEXT_387341 [Caerostris extrusa]
MPCKTGFTLLPNDKRINPPIRREGRRESFLNRTMAPNLNNAYALLCTVAMETREGGEEARCSGKRPLISIPFRKTSPLITRLPGTGTGSTILNPRAVCLREPAHAI